MNIHTDRDYSEFKLPLMKMNYSLLQKALVDRGYAEDRYGMLDPGCGGTTNETVTEKRKAYLVKFYLQALALGADLDTIPSPSCTAVNNLVLDLSGSFASLSTSLTGANNDMVITANKRGAIGNLIQVQLVDPSANNAALAVTVVGNLIRVALATGAGGAITSTATLVIAAINNHATAKTLVTATKKGSDTGAGVVTALAATNLTGGTD